MVFLSLAQIFTRKQALLLTISRIWRSRETFQASCPQLFWYRTAGRSMKDLCCHCQNYHKPEKYLSFEPLVCKLFQCYSCSKMRMKWEKLCVVGGTFYSIYQRLTVTFYLLKATAKFTSASLGAKFFWLRRTLWKAHSEGETLVLSEVASKTPVGFSQSSTMS